MERQIIIPKDDQEWLQMRTQDITSTDCAALFELSPYLSRYELWHRKRSREIITLGANQRMLWGNRLESAIATGVSEDHGMKIRPMKEYIRIPAWRIGCSFDFFVESEDAILEIKNVDSLAYKDGWIVEGNNVEAPAHIELQAQFQMLVSGKARVYIAALVGGNRVILIRREADPEIHEAIKAKVAAFWESIDMNQEPTPDFKVDARFISKMNGYAEPGKVLQDSSNKLAELVSIYKKWSTIETDAKEEKEGVKAQILTMIGDAEKVIGERFTISAGVTPPTLIEAYERKAFRNFKVYTKKEKS